MQKNKTMALRVIICCLLFTTYCLPVNAIQATVSHTLFYKKNKKDSSQLEANIVLSWRAQNSSIHFKKNESGLFDAEMVCIIRLSTDTSIVKEETFIIKTPPQNKPEQVIHQLIADQYEYRVAPGNYEIELVLYEQNYKSELYQYTEQFVVPAAKKEQYFLSEIQLLDTTFISNEKTIYSRNNRIDLSLGSNYINERKDSVVFYFELYPSVISKTKNRNIWVSSFISFKSLEAEIPQYLQIDTVSAQEKTQGFYKKFAIKKLNSGNYYLNTLLVEDNIIIDKKTLFFQLYNPNPIISRDSTTATIDSLKKEKDNSEVTHVLDLTNTFVGKYTAVQVRAILKMMLLICDANEGNSINGFLRKPDELYSKYFIYNFWEKRDKVNPERAWKAYAEKVKETNRLFKGSGRSGFETDRGRVYIQYGKPNDRVIVNNESGALPYEIWQYYSLEKQAGPGVFLFYKSGNTMGDYQLLHSTVVGEKRNGSWRSLLYNNSITGSGNIVTDSRAEQFIGNK